MTVLYTMVEYLTSFVEVYVLLCIYGLFFEKRFSRIKHVAIQLGTAFVMTLVTLSLNKLALYSYVTFVVWQLLISALSIILFKNNFVKALCISVVYAVLINAVDFLTVSIIELIFNVKGITLEVMTTTGPLRSAFILFVKALLVIVYFILARKKQLRTIFDTKTCLIVIASGVFCFFCMQYLIEAVIIGNVADMRRAVLIAWLFIFLFIISFILILRGNMRFAAEKMANSIVSTRLEVLEEDNRHLNDAYGEIAKLSHDFKNHMRAMTMLAQNRKYSDLTKYLNEVSTDVNSLRIISYTGVESVDAVINNKKASADKHGIHIEIDVSPLYDLHIRSMDLCAVLVNLLDNAIEASQKLIEADKRRIRLSISCIHSMIMIKTENAYDTDSSIRVSNGKLETTKKNRQLHGYGLQIVKTIVDKYNGSFEINHDDQKFVAVAMLSNGN